MDNADLQKLRVAPGKLVPKFRSEVTEYSITVASSVAEVKLTPITSDAGASCAVKGDASGKTVQLTEGCTSLVELLVTAEDGRTTKSYTITIRRLSADDACLSQLELSAGTIKPSFSPGVYEYFCFLPSSLDAITLRASTEDAAMKVAMKDGSPVGKVAISAGHSLLEVQVTSVSGKNTTLYSLTTIRMRSPYELLLKESSPQFSCGICGGTIHCPCRVRGSLLQVLYCWRCLEEVTRISKADPLTGKLLGEKWLVMDYEADRQLSSLVGVCHTPYGQLEGEVTQLPAMVLQQRASYKEPAEQACAECSKKIPSTLMEVHKQLCCSSSLSSFPLKFEVKVAPWQKQMVNATLPADIQAILRTAEQVEQRYVSGLETHGPPEAGGAEMREHLLNAASCYATAISQSPLDPRGHTGLALVLEELFYAEDMYGIEHNESSLDASEENDAECSSKEEEFQAICRLHGVPPSATLAQQLMAVDKELQQLKESGHTHKAEHVQQLYAWKSKRALQTAKGAYSIDTEGPLQRAKEKLQHAVALNSSDHSSLFHLGRLSLLLGDKQTAESCLLMAASIKPTHPDTLLCLGLAVSATSSSKMLLSHGLTHYLREREKSAESAEHKLKGLHSRNFWRPSNALIGEAFLLLGQLNGHGFLSRIDCLMQATRLFSDCPGLHKGSTHQQLVWTLLRSRAALLDIACQKKNSNASSLCEQLSAIIAHCQLPATTELRELQMKVFQTGALLQPTSSKALNHLGNGQLMQYEATGDKQWLTAAELSFRASLSLEGKPIGQGEPPAQLLQQPWWKASGQKRSENVGKSPAAPAPTKGPTRQPVATPAKPPTTAASKPTTITARKPPSTTANKPAASRASKPTTNTAVKQPTVRQPAAAAAAKPAGRGRPQAVAPNKSQAMGGKGVATLGDLKAGAKQSETNKQPSSPTNQQSSTVPQPPITTTSVPSPSPATALNHTSHHPRLGLARVLAKQTDGKPSEECTSLYQEVIKMSPDVHDAYIELGELLAHSDPLAAVGVYSRFPFSETPSFDDAYLHGEIVRILMASESYDDPRLSSSMVAMGQALGIAVLDRHVSTLEAKFKTNLLKQVYAGVHQKKIDDPDLQAFFKFKCWT